MPFNLGPEFDALVSQYAAEDLIAQRKRLREARLRWIEENECPTSYSVDTIGKDGKEVTFATPFQVGKIHYPDKYDDTWKEQPQKHEDPAAEMQLLDGIDAILQEADEPSTEKQLTVLVGADGTQSAFFTGGKDQSPHPPIMEGESYADYHARVCRSYEQQTGSTAGRRPVAGDDGLRESAPVDSPGDGRALTPGGTTGAEARSSVDRDSDAVLLVASRPSDGSASESAPVPDAAASAGIPGGAGRDE